jgi:hypothetical protein
LPKCACEGANRVAQAARCTEAEHQLNRRTTVKFLDLNYSPKSKEVVKPGTNQPGKPIRQRPGGK